MANKKYQLLSISFIILGAVTLALSLLGDMSPLGDYKSFPPRAWEKFDKKLAAETSTIALLKSKIDASLTHSLTR